MRRPKKLTTSDQWELGLFMGMRVTEEEEYVGLDIAQHGERVGA